MTNLLPWPEEILSTAGRAGPLRLLERLRALADADTLPHALLLLGPPGLGREGVALELAAALVCREGGLIGCECGSCKRVRRGLHPDVTLVAVESGHQDIRIEQSRDLVDSLTRRPYESKRHVVIVASAHTPPLNTEAASALLKALEEPPQHVTFVLLASNPGRVLPTILSRAVVVRVPRPDEARPASSEDGVPPVPSWAAATGETALAGDLAALPASLEALLSEDLNAVPLVCNFTREGVTPVVGALLDLAAATADERAEECLDLAASLLTAERRARALRLDLEAAATAAVAATVRLRGSPSKD